MHLQASSLWSKVMKREATGETEAHLLGPNQIEKNRYYVKSIGEVVTFLRAQILGKKMMCL